MCSNEIFVKFCQYLKDLGYGFEEIYDFDINSMNYLKDICMKAQIENFQSIFSLYKILLSQINESSNEVLLFLKEYAPNIRTRVSIRLPTNSKFINDTNKKVLKRIQRLNSVEEFRTPVVSKRQELQHTELPEIIQNNIHKSSSLKGQPHSKTPNYQDLIKYKNQEKPNPFEEEIV